MIMIWSVKSKIIIYGEKVGEVYWLYYFIGNL